MRLYLSSFRLGDHPEQLVRLAGAGGRAAVIANAMDGATEAVRRQSVELELRELAGLGFTAGEVDLRGYFGDPAGLRAVLAGHDLLWVRGGNTFMLRYALHRSGDEVLPGLLAGDALAYGGYSAGACVLAPSLRGLEAVDDAGEVTSTYQTAPVWDGLGVLDYAIVPHCQSEHPESAGCDAVAARYRAEGVEHRALRDGQALVIRDGQVTLC